MIASAGALALVIGGLSLQCIRSHGSLLPLAQKVVTLSTTPGVSKATNIDAQAPTITPEPASAETADNDGDVDSSQPAGTLEPKMNQILDATSDCADKMAAAVNSYNDAVQKKKNDLISSITFPPVPFSISSGYVASFNDSITELFNQYVSEADAAHCTWPLKAPATLPLNFNGQ